MEILAVAAAILLLLAVFNQVSCYPYLIIPNWDYYLGQQLTWDSHPRVGTQNTFSRQNTAWMKNEFTK
jgi:hypothetical protein